MLLHFLQQYVDLPETIVEKLSLDEEAEEEDEHNKDEQVQTPPSQTFPRTAVLKKRKWLSFFPSISLLIEVR